MSQSAKSLARALAAAERGETALLFPSGTTALCVAALTSVGRRRKILVSSNSYPPLMSALEWLAHAARIEYEFFDPNSAGDARPRIDDSVAAVMAETFGSWTFEFTDVAGLGVACKAAGARLIVNNTTATPLHFNPIEAGADIVVHSLAKYIGGRGDLFGGAMVAAPRCAAEVNDAVRLLGFHLEEFPEHVARRVLAGWETLPLRLERAQANAARLVPSVRLLPGLSRCFHPLAEPGPRVASLARGFPSLLGLRFKADREELEARIARGLDVGVGFGWGGGKSRLLLLPQAFWNRRPVFADGKLARLYVGHDSIDERLLESIRRIFAPPPRHACGELPASFS